MSGPHDPAVPGPGQFRASHADREQAIGLLKAAFVQDRLTRDELDARVGRALYARTCAELAALTADIPSGAGPARPPTAARRRPLARAPVAAGICLLVAVAAIAAMWVASIADPGGPDPTWTGLGVALAVSGVWAAIGIMGCAVVTSLDQRPSRGQLPPRPGPGGHALEAGQRGGTGQIGHDRALPRDRPDQARANLRSDSPRPGGPYSSGRGARAPRGIRPVPGVV
jgi:hypothetical protein